MSKVSHKVFDKIKSKNITPSPRWRFMLRNYLLWIAGALSILIGALASAIIFHILFNSDFDMHRRMHDNSFEFIISSLPYFWIMFLAIFVFIADYYLKHTKKGYKFSIKKVTIFVIMLSMMLGGVLYGVGVGQRMEMVSQGSYIYKTMSHDRVSNWTRRDNLLAGKILEIQEDDSFILRDFNNEEWIVFSDKAMLVGIDSLENDMEIRLFGEKINDKMFIAQRILPWQTRPFLMKGIHKECIGEGSCMRHNLVK